MSNISEKFERPNISWLEIVSRIPKTTVQRRLQENNRKFGCIMNL